MAGAYGWYLLTDFAKRGDWIYTDHGTACLLTRCTLVTSCAGDWMVRKTATGGDVNVVYGWYALHDGGTGRHRAWIWANGRGKDAIKTLMSWGSGFTPVRPRTRVLDARGSEILGWKRSCGAHGWPR